MGLFLNMLSSMANWLGISTVNTRCEWIYFQDEEPKSLKKYKKF